MLISWGSSLEKNLVRTMLKDKINRERLMYSFVFFGIGAVSLYKLVSYGDALYLKWGAATGFAGVAYVSIWFFLGTFLFVSSFFQKKKNPEEKDRRKF